MSDHVDGPWSIGDLSSDVTDFFAFTSPENRRASHDDNDRARALRHNAGNLSRSRQAALAVGRSKHHQEQA